MKILLIVGYWNSGTTLLVDILRKHPKLTLRRARWLPNLEERTIQKLLKRLGSDFIQFDENYKTVVNQGFTHYEEPQFDEEKSRQFERLFNQKFGVKAPKILLLKNPWLFFMPNFLKKELFEKHEVKTIIILRNGAMQTVSKDYWLKDTSNAEEKLYARAKFWERSMAYYFENWHQKSDVLTISYQNLCEHTANSIREICSFGGIDFEPLSQKIPADLRIKTKKWDTLPIDYQKNVLEIVGEMQEKVDRQVFNKK